MTCTDEWWAGGMQPEWLKMTFTGWSQGPDWEEYQPEVPEGIFWLPFDYCNRWTFSVSNFLIQVSVGEDYIGTTIEESLTPTSWFDTLTKEDPVIWTPDYENYKYSLLPGCCQLELFTIGYMEKPSWEVADLFGIPRTMDFLAEQGYTGLDRKHYRYCSAGTDSNVKIIML